MKKCVFYKNKVLGYIILSAYELPWFHCKLDTLVCSNSTLNFNSYSKLEFFQCGFFKIILTKHLAGRMKLLHGPDLTSGRSLPITDLSKDVDCLGIARYGT